VKFRPLPWSVLLAAGLFAVAQAKEPPPQVIVWPPSGQSVVRFSLGRFKEVGSSGKQRNYTVDVTAENLWAKRIPQAQFSLYLFDKNQARIGEGYISISDVAPGQVIKFQVGIMAAGLPVSVALAPQLLPPELQSYLPPKTVSITINSVPQGADVKVDGVAEGTTPKIINVTPGKHMLEFSKEGFNTGHFPLEIAQDAVSGGSVSYELGSSVHDTVELRDGSVISGDVESVSASEVVVRIGGTIQHLDRNTVKRISLVPRETASQ
jgi:hypothetical protein